MDRPRKCDWCGVELDPGIRIDLIKPGRNMGAAFCRLEHIVPWLMNKNDWHILDAAEVPEGAETHCSWTGNELDQSSLYLVKSREGVEVVDGFLDPDSLLKWARAGGRFRPS